MIDHWWFVPIAFICGSIPSGLLLTKILSGRDIRTTGSGNIGATNVTRTLGLGVGIATLVFDALKGALPVLAAMHFTGDPVVWGACAFASVLGHCHSIFLRFSGGKGVATALGVFLALGPIATAAAALLFVVVVWVKRYVSLGSLISAAAFPPLYLLIQRPVRPLLLFSVLTSLVIIARHAENIRRLVDGTERKFGERRDG